MKASSLGEGGAQVAVWDASIRALHWALATLTARSAWPMNCSVQPTANSTIGTTRGADASHAMANHAIEMTISGMPSVWQKRLTGC